MKRLALVALLAVSCGTAELPSPSPSGTHRATASPSPSPTFAARVLPEADAWTLVRATIRSDLAAVTPTWLPDGVDRTKVVIDDLAADRYTVTYRRDGKPAVSFALGAVSPYRSRSGEVVRGTAAIFSFPTDAISPLPKLVTWTEGDASYAIRGTSLTGDELMTVAWHVTSTAPPPQPPHPYLREKPGACSRPGMTPEDVVRKLLSLGTSGDEAAVRDCYALDWLQQRAPGGGPGWSSVGPLRDVVLQRMGTVGDRIVVAATWSWANPTPPPGAWGPDGASLFYTLGIEDDRYRIYEAGTGVIAYPR